MGTVKTGCLSAFRHSFEFVLAPVVKSKKKPDAGNIAKQRERDARLAAPGRPGGGFILEDRDGWA
jgi:hypothetical protein